MLNTIRNKKEEVKSRILSGNTFKKFNLHLFAMLLVIFTPSIQICMAQDVPDPSAYTTASGFVTNDGQLFGNDTLQHPEILYYGNAGNTTLYLSNSVFSYSFAHAVVDTAISDSLHTNYKTDSLYRMDMKLKDTRNDYDILASDTSQGYCNYYFGDSAWTHALTYQEIKYSGIYTGIDLAFYNNDEFRFYLDSNATNAIKFYYQGPDSIRIIHDSLLNIYTRLGSKQYIVKAYEYKDESWNKFTTRLIKTDSLISFAFGTHTSGIPIMLIASIYIPTTAPPVPSELRWSTYYVEASPPFASNNYFSDIFIDESDHVYVVGWSTSATFPVTPPPTAIQAANYGLNDATVVKFNPDRTREFATYYGGSEDDAGQAITVDGNDNIIFAGYTYSDDITASIPFPICASCPGYQQPFGGPFGGNPGTRDAFIVKLTSTGALSLSTGMSMYYGGSASEFNISIAIDNANNFVIGGMATGAVPIPTANPGFYHDFNGGVADGFLAKFGLVLGVENQPIWATHLGGDADDRILSVCTDASDNIYAFGYTTSATTFPSEGWPLTSYTGTDFPICVGPPEFVYQFVRGYSGGSDHFVCKFTDHSLAWSTDFGGQDFEPPGGDIAVSPLNGDIFITGGTFSNESNDHFPIKDLSGAYYDYTYAGGGGDGYIAKFDDEFELKWCTYYGDDVGPDYCTSIAINNNGDVYVAGVTSSSNLIMFSSNCQLFYDDTYGGSGDNFILRFDADCSSFYRTYFGGTNYDYISSIACQKNSLNSYLNIVVAGNTTSTMAQDFPLRDNNYGNQNDYYNYTLPTGTGYGPYAFVSNLRDDNSACRIAGNGDETIKTIISVFPNPAEGIVSISSSGDEIRSIQIIDIMGKIVFSNNNASNNLYKCDLRLLPDGIYISEVLISGSVYRNKIIISH